MLTLRRPHRRGKESDYFGMWDSQNQLPRGKGLEVLNNFLLLCNVSITLSVKEGVVAGTMSRRTSFHSEGNENAKESVAGDELVDVIDVRADRCSAEFY